MCPNTCTIYYAVSMYSKCNVNLCYTLCSYTIVHCYTVIYLLYSYIYYTVIFTVLYNMIYFWDCYFIHNLFLFLHCRQKWICRNNCSNASFRAKTFTRKHYCAQFEVINILYHVYPHIAFYSFDLFRGRCRPKFCVIRDQGA